MLLFYKKTFHDVVVVVWSLQLSSYHHDCCEGKKGRKDISDATLLNETIIDDTAKDIID